MSIKKAPKGGLNINLVKVDQERVQPIVPSVPTVTLALFTPTEVVALRHVRPAAVPDQLPAKVAAAAAVQRLGAEPTPPERI
jgi:hypothetical protein